MCFCDPYFRRHAGHRIRLTGARWRVGWASTQSYSYRLPRHPWEPGRERVWCGQACWVRVDLEGGSGRAREGGPLRLSCDHAGSMPAASAVVPSRAGQGGLSTGHCSAALAFSQLLALGSLALSGPFPLFPDKVPRRPCVVGREGKEPNPSGPRTWRVV